MSGLLFSPGVRLFRRHFQRHPLEYLIGLRLEFARSMLTATDLPLKEISWRSGYSSPYYFSTAFRKKYGAAPREYRKSAIYMGQFGTGH